MCKIVSWNSFSVLNIFRTFFVARQEHVRTERNWFIIQECWVYVMHRSQCAPQSVPNRCHHNQQAHHSRLLHMWCITHGTHRFRHKKMSAAKVTTSINYDEFQLINMTIMYQVLVPRNFRAHPLIYDEKVECYKFRQVRVSINLLSL